MSWREDALIEYAETEANEIARCLYNFRQKHNSCGGCSTRGFCDALMEKLEDYEEDNDE